MNGTITMSVTPAIKPRTGNWVTRGSSATGQGIAHFGRTLAAFGLLTALLIAVALTPLYVGFPLVAGTLRGMRGLAAQVGRSLGFTVAASDRPALDDRPGFWGRFGVLITDPVTWRDLLWTLVDVLVGWVFTLFPIGLVLWGLFGVVMPALWHPIINAHGNNWYAFIHVTSAGTAWLSVALGVGFVALGLLTAPWFIRRYAAFARSVLGTAPAA